MYLPDGENRSHLRTLLLLFTEWNQDKNVNFSLEFLTQYFTNCWDRRQNTKICMFDSILYIPCRCGPENEECTMTCKLSLWRPTRCRSVCYRLCRVVWLLPCTDQLAKDYRKYKKAPKNSTLFGLQMPQTLATYTKHFKELHKLQVNGGNPLLLAPNFLSLARIICGIRNQLK
jgi:hypothetical protein